MKGPNECGCCKGLEIGTPAEVYNRPALSALVYRAGTHSRFKRSMLARLSDSGLPALGGLNTRSDDDFAVALLDAWATVADVLTFYSERIANESYLRTATERISLLHLARLIGYELGPGVAASTHLAFELEDVPGAPEVVAIRKGTRVQSLPGQDEHPQPFETVEGIEARPEWNRLRPRLGAARKPGMDETEVYLKGVSTGLVPGDGLLLVGTEREEDPSADNWDFRRVKTVTPNPDAGHTRVVWDRGLGWRRFNRTVPPAEYPKVYALRRRASLFGHNAPDWRSMPRTIQTNFEDKPQNTSGGSAPESGVSRDNWPRFELSSEDTINLDAVYPQILPDSWVLLSVPNYEEVYQVEDVEEESSADFTLTAKTTRLKLRGENLKEEFGDRRRDTTVFAESEFLEMAGYPLGTPVEGDEIPLDRPLRDFEARRTVIVSGKRTRVAVAEGVEDLALTDADNSRTVALAPGDSLRVVEPSREIPQASSSATRLFRWHLVDEYGFVGFVEAGEGQILPVPTHEDDESVSEVAYAEMKPADNATLVLSEPLKNSYDRATTIIHANVAPATHGESTQEVLGSGDAAATFQRFTLREPPLTYTSSAVPGGVESTLEVRVDDVKWHEVQSLYGRGPEERVFVTRRDDVGGTTVLFGDGRTGARLPTGTENVRATYRKGTGTNGLVRAGQLSLLMTPVFGVRSVKNLLAPTGAEDLEAGDEARRNAPMTVLTLDRVVSLRDYEDFARAYAGVAKANATWIWTGETGEVFVTVAGTGGRSVEGEVLKNLVTALRAAGDRNLPLSVKEYREARFGTRARLRTDPDLLSERVVEAAAEALAERFGFEARSFGQGVALSEVVAALQAVEGVMMVDVEELYRLPKDPEEEQPQPFLEAKAPVAGQEGAVDPAELLTLDTAKLVLEMMP